MNIEGRNKVIVLKQMESFFEFSLVPSIRDNTSGDDSHSYWSGGKLFNNYILELTLYQGPAFSNKEIFFISCFVKDVKSGVQIVDFQIAFSSLHIANPICINPMERNREKVENAEILYFENHANSRLNSFSIEKRNGLFSFCSFG